MDTVQKLSTSKSEQGLFLHFPQITEEEWSIPVMRFQIIISYYCYLYSNAYSALLVVYLFAV
jgi:hypothetical protein